MPIPASLVASIINALVEVAMSASNPTQYYETYATQRILPPEAKQGVMQPPGYDGTVTIGELKLPTSPATQYRNDQNRIVMPMTIQNPTEVVYITDASGAVFRVWMLHPVESANRPTP